MCSAGRCETQLTQEAGGQLTMNKVQPLASDCQKDSSSCEIERAVLIGYYCVLLWHMDPVSEDPGSGDGGTTAVQHQQNASRETQTQTHTQTRTLLLMEDTLSIPLFVGPVLKYADAAWTAGRRSRQQQNCRKNIHLFNLVLADLQADRRNVSKQNPSATSHSRQQLFATLL